MLLDEQILAITYMPKEAREETMLRKKWRDDRGKETPDWSEALGHHFTFSLWIHFLNLFHSPNFHPKNSMWVPTISSVTDYKSELQKQSLQPGAPAKHSVTWQGSGRAGHLVDPHVLVDAQVPKFLPQCKCVHVAEFQSLEEFMCWFCYVRIICCFFINLYINLKAS